MVSQMTKKQDIALKIACRLIKNREIIHHQREWDSLFEDGYNNSNSLIIELIKELEDDWRLCEGIIAQSRFMPDVLLSYAKYYNKDNEGDALSSFLNKADDIHREITLFDKKINSDDFEYLYKYYIDPLHEEG